MIDEGKPSTREEQARRLAESLKRQLGAFCPLLMERDVVELMLNADGRLWVDRLGQPMTPVGKIAAPTAESFIATVASMLRGAVTRELDLGGPLGHLPVPSLLGQGSQKGKYEACHALVEAADSPMRPRTPI